MNRRAPAPRIRRYLAGLVAGTVDLLGRRRPEPEHWWGESVPAAGPVASRH